MADIASRDSVDNHDGNHRDKLNRRLRRPEAARYVSERHHPCSPQWLAKLASVGGGPAFRKAGRIVLYDTADLDAWASGRLSKLVTSTSELREAA